MAEYEINLENLVKMKRVFEEADEDGSGELDPDEFYEQLGPYLGQGLPPAAVSQLFMRIDADCGGTIDWQEFIDYFFLQRAASSAADSGEDWRLHAEDHGRRGWRGTGRGEAAELVYCCGSLGRYITGGRGGTLRVWDAASLAPVQALTNGSGWVSDCAYLECPAYKRLVVAAHDRTLTWYESARTGFEFSARLSCPGAMGAPLCLAELQRNVVEGGAPRLVWGDTEGSVMLLKCDPPPLHTERQLAPGRDFEVLHSGHTDWVTCLQHIPDVGLVSSSLDSTLRMLDLERGVLAASVGVHRKGVRTFAHSPAFSLVASGGVERSVLLWQPKGNVNKPVGELPGHASGVAQLLVADEQSQVITLAEDHTVRVWDLRNHKCVQTIGRTDWLRPEDGKPSAMAYDTSRRRLVCASHRLVAWSHRRVEVERRHDARLVAALYNQTFSVVVSGDEGGTICMWNVQTGQREGGFSLHAKPAAPGGGGGPGLPAGAMLGPAALPKLTAMAFDSNQRRLLTALDEGAVRMYNFNSGAVLREFTSREKELTAVAFVPRAEPPSEQGQQTGRAADGGGEAARQGEVEAVPLPPAGCVDSSGHALVQQQQQQQEGDQQPIQAQLTPRSLHNGGKPASSLAGSPAPGSAASTSTTGKASSNLVLATGWGRSLCVWEEGEEARSSRCRRLKGHGSDVLCMAPLGRDVVATGDFDGEVCVWHLPSGTCVARCSYGGQEFERAVRCLCWVPTGGSSAAGSALGESSGCNGRGSPHGQGNCQGAPHALLLVAGDDGGLQSWLVPLPPSSTTLSPASCPPGTSSAAGPDAGATPANAFRLVASWQATHRSQDCITSLRLDTGPSSRPGQLWTGDSSGHVALWDLSAVLAACSCSEAAPADTPGGSSLATSAADVEPVQHQQTASLVPPVAMAAAAADAFAAASMQATRLLLWQAAGASVVGLDLLQGAGRGLLLVGGQDAGIGIWTRQGGLVGVFGIHSWELEDPASWQDPDAAAVPPPLSDSQEKNGLAPRQIIAATPGRRNWAVSGGVTAEAVECSGRLTRGAAGSGPGVAGSSSSSSRSSSAPACQAGQAAAEQQEELLAGLAQLRLPVSEPDSKPSSPLPALALPAAAEQPLQAPAAGKAGQGSSATSTLPHGGSNSAAVQQFLSPESVGARLGALAAGAASSKAASWALPFVQVHSALELQPMRAVPPDTVGMWAQLKTQDGPTGRDHEQGTAKQASSHKNGLHKGRPASPHVAPSIAAIVSRGSSTALCRRSSAEPAGGPPACLQRQG
ncbi:hypothetical protein ABPG77_007492 [Micractinium sp. CCAP 211/92]